MPRRPLLVLTILLAVAPRPAAGQAGRRLPYMDPRRSPGERAQDLLGRMTLEEKFWQLYMSPGDLDDRAVDYSHGSFGLQVRPLPGDSVDPARGYARRINAIQRYFVTRTRLGIPIIPFDEALHGLVQPGATVFPQAIGLAATWDTALVGRVAAAVAQETAGRGVRQVLSPVVNLSRDVRWGRTEETYGEDPHLASSMARVFVGAFERAGVVATPKHFVANVGDGGRDSYPIALSARELDEVYFPPFAAALRDAHARSVMTAYNSVDGVPATQNHWLLTDVLKRRWGFDGYVISDAAATGGATVLHLTEPDTPHAARDAWRAGLDVVFQSSYPQYRPYWSAVRDGLVPPAVIDSAVARVLRVKFALGLFDHPYVDPDSAATWNGSAAHRALAREAARESLVLLRNHRLLPLPDTIRSLAVIGPDAVDARLGGYSGPGVRPVSILAGLTSRLGAGRVRYAAGPGRASDDLAVIPAGRLGADSEGPGLRAEYFDNPELLGAPQLVRVDSQVSFAWTLSGPARGLRRDWYSVRWTGTLAVPVAGATRIGIRGDDGFRLYLNDSLVIDDWGKRSAGTRLARVELEGGRAYAIRLEYRETRGNAHVQLVWNAGRPDPWQARIDSAAAVARSADVAVVVVGIEEGEFRDRASLALPGHQEDLIRAVAATGTPIVVVVIGGSAVTMSGWLGRVDAVLDAWYPGEAGGDAVADVLLGDADPAGRLPITFPITEGQLPLPYDHKPTGRGDDYVDLTGEPLFPFGYGRSYTTFAYSGLTITPDTIGASGRATVRCRVKNVGGRAGDEVVQLYLHDELASVARPVISLAGFERVHLAPGEEREIAFSVGAPELRLLNDRGRWVVEPGSFRVMVGASSKDVRLAGDLRVR
jgi:beta-glucosidase